MLNNTKSYRKKLCSPCKLKDVLQCLVICTRMICNDFMPYNCLPAPNMNASYHMSPLFYVVILWWVHQASRDPAVVMPKMFLSNSIYSTYICAIARSATLALFAHGVLYRAEFLVKCPIQALLWKPVQCSCQRHRRTSLISSACVHIYTYADELQQIGDVVLRHLSMKFCYRHTWCNCCLSPWPAELVASSGKGI